MGIVKKNCLNCGDEFQADTRAVNRGWGLYCGKSCKAYHAGKKGKSDETPAKELNDVIFSAEGTKESGYNLSYDELNSKINEELDLLASSLSENKINFFIESEAPTIPLISHSNNIITHLKYFEGAGALIKVDTVPQSIVLSLLCIDDKLRLIRSFKSLK